MATETLSIGEAAPILGIGATSLRQLVHAGRIRYMRIGGVQQGRIRFRREWLEEYLASCVCEPRDATATIPRIVRQSQPQPTAIYRSGRDRALAMRVAK